MLRRNFQNTHYIVPQLPFRTFQRLCFPLVSIGKQHIARKAASINPPEAKTGALGLAPPAWIATIGAHRPAILFRHDAMPVPVPRFGAGKTSGVLHRLSSFSLLSSVAMKLTMRIRHRT